MGMRWVASSSENLKSSFPRRRESLLLFIPHKKAKATAGAIPAFAGMTIWKIMTAEKIERTT
jgi:hypothetical protein